MKIENAVALVTGASRGIGRAIALELAERGARIIALARTLEPDDRRPGSLVETAALIRAAGGEVELVQADLSNSESIAAIGEKAVQTWGRVDVLVNNAAFLGRATFDDLDTLTLSSWNRQVALNVTAPLAMCQAIVPSMRAHGGGVIANITSAAAELFEGNVPGLPYGTTKAALNRLTLALARDLRPDGIAVVALDPGYVRTEVAEQAATDGRWDMDIDTAHPPAVVGRAVAELVCARADDVSGRIWRAVQDGPTELVHDGRGMGPH